MNKNIESPARLAQHASPYLIPFEQPLVSAVFLERRKRFLVRVKQGSDTFWIHTNNSGSMMGLLRKGRPVLMSHSSNPKRKYAYTLEAIKIDTHWCGVNTMIPNRLLRPLFLHGRLPLPEGYSDVATEVRTGKSRLDGLLTGPGLPKWWLEAKNVSLVEEEVAYFPDAITARGARHMDDLGGLVEQGDKASCIFIVQRSDARCFSPADFIDKAYAEAFTRALEKGVQMWVFQTSVDRGGIRLQGQLPLAKSVD